MTPHSPPNRILHVRDAQQNEIDQLLRYFDQAVPPVGFESRVLRRLAAAQSAAPARRMQSWRWPVLAISSAAALAALLLIHSRPTAPPLPAAVPSAPRVAQAGPSPAVEAPRHQPLRAVRRHSAPGFHSPSQVSFPAPPAPLTAQEKLLLQVAASSDLAPREILNPVLSAQLRAAGDAEFERFLHPSTDPVTHRSN